MPRYTVNDDLNDLDAYMNWLKLVMNGYSLHITLDGVAVGPCITADEEKGEVVCIEKNDDGSFKVKDDNLVTCVKKGVVVVTVVERDT